MSQYQSALIGRMLLDGGGINEVDITADELGNTPQAEIFRAIADLETANEPYDAVIVRDKLFKKTGKDYSQMIANVIGFAGARVNLQAYADAVREENQKSRAKEIATLLSDTIDRSGMEAVDLAIKELMSLNQTRRNYEYTIIDAAKLAIDEIERVYKTGGKITGIKTGLIDLDNALGGFQDSDLVVIPARPSMGKTALLINLALSAEEPAGIISAEQAVTQVGLRMIAINGRVSLHKMRRADLEETDWPKITATVAKFNDSRMWVNDKSAITIAEVMRQARKWKHQYDIKILYVDYLQRISATNKRVQRYEQIGEVVMGLKELAKELDIPVVALAQVNREVEKRDNKRPGMGDIANSSEVEKEADVIMSLYRDEVYHQDTDDGGIAELSILKNRHGPIGKIRTYWYAEFMRFENAMSGGTK